MKIANISEGLCPYFVEYLALTMLISSISMSLSSGAYNCLAFLREVSGFTDFALTDKTVSTALRLDFVKSNSTHDANRLSINGSKTQLRPTVSFRQEQ